jgi:3-oxoacyl-[acyl-carrier protein] reductase
VAESVVHQVIDRFGHLDILVNNAGIWERNPIDHPRAETAWDNTIKTNLKSTFNITFHSVPYLRKTKGRIINIASTAGQRGEAYYSDYASSKGGIIAFTKSLATELGPHQVLVNAVSPGWVWTDMTIKHLSKPAYRKAALREIPLGKFAQPEDVAGAVLFLASPLSSHITGAVINVNGGSVL